MGLGDEIMASADAREAKENNPEAQVVFGKRGRARKWDKNQEIIFANNPYITKAEDIDLSGEIIYLKNFRTGIRPYIDHVKKRELKLKFKRQIAWSDYKVKKGDIFFSREDWCFPLAAGKFLAKGIFTSVVWPPINFPASFGISIS